MVRTNWKTLVAFEAVFVALLFACTATLYVVGERLFGDAQLLEYHSLSRARQRLYLTLLSPHDRHILEVEQALLSLEVLLVVSPMYAGLFNAFFCAMRRADGGMRVADVFEPFRSAYVLRLVLMLVVRNLFVALGFAMLLLPGLFLHLLFSLAVPLHVDNRHLGALSALRASATVVGRYFCTVAGFYVLSCGVLLLGALALVVGLAAAVPAMMAAEAFMVLHLVGVSGCPLRHGAVGRYPSSDSDEPGGENGEGERLLSTGGTADGDDARELDARV